MPTGVALNFDDAWDSSRLPMPVVDCLRWGPGLRYCAPEPLLRRAFGEFREHLAGERFVLYGSGDFHHLAAWFLRTRLEHSPELRDVRLVSFDNHPDWDIRPPRWGCGGWINRALEYPQVGNVTVWGCGNFELAFPSRIFRNRRALANGRLAVHAWAQRQSGATARRFHCMNASDCPTMPNSTSNTNWCRRTSTCGT